MVSETLLEDDLAGQQEDSRLHLSVAQNRQDPREQDSEVALQAGQADYAKPKSLQESAAAA